jgi:hypothetical protein
MPCLPKPPVLQLCSSSQRRLYRSLLPNTESSSHEVCALLEIRLVIALVEQALDVTILRHLAPLVPLFLLLHDFLRERRRGCIFDAIIRCWDCLLLPFLLLRFVVVLALLALLASWRLLERVREAFFPQCFDAEIQARNVGWERGEDGYNIVLGVLFVALLVVSSLLLHFQTRTTYLQTPAALDLLDHTPRKCVSTWNKIHRLCADSQLAPGDRTHPLLPAPA